MYSVLTSLLLLVPAPAESLLVSADWLKAHRGDPDLVLLHVDHRSDTTSPPAELIPGSVTLDYMAIIRNVGDVSSELPPMDSLRSVLEAVGVSNASRVVLYSSDPLMAARAFMTLEVAGLDRIHVLDGGADAWKASGGAVTTTATAPRGRGHFTPAPRQDIVVEADWVRARLDDPAIALIDTRTTEEYTGSGERHGIRSDGHLAGARQLIWEEMIAGEPPTWRVKPRAELLAMYRDRGAAEGKTVVTYCYSGYRASFSYLVARYLGFDARFYDGSYNDWSLKQYPLVKGSAPR